MTIVGEKYLGWQLDGISLETGIFTVRLGRYVFPADADLTAQHAQARLIFVCPEKITFSNAHSDAQIINVDCCTEETGNIRCDLKFLPESSISVIARDVLDLSF